MEPSSSPFCGTWIYAATTSAVFGHAVSSLNQSSTTSSSPTFDLSLASMLRGLSMGYSVSIQLFREIDTLHVITFLCEFILAIVISHKFCQNPNFICVSIYYTELKIFERRWKERAGERAGGRAGGNLFSCVWLVINSRLSVIGREYIWIQLDIIFRYSSLIYSNHTRSFWYTVYFLSISCLVGYLDTI